MKTTYKVKVKEKNSRGEVVERVLDFKTEDLDWTMNEYSRNRVVLGYEIVEQNLPKNNLILG